MKCFTPQHGRYLHPLATTDRPLCQRTGFYLLLRDLEIKRNINKLKTCKYRQQRENNYGMAKGAFAVLLWTPRSWLIYTMRTVSTFCCCWKKALYLSVNVFSTKVLQGVPKVRSSNSRHNNFWSKLYFYMKFLDVCFSIKYVYSEF